MNKMKPEDVIRALECCASGNCIVDNCPLFSWDDGKEIYRCTSDLTKEALALLRETIDHVKQLRQYTQKQSDEITSLQMGWSEDQERVRKILDEKDAEIERLYKSLNETAKEQYINGRADAITEFAERLKKFYAHLGGKTVGGSVEYHIEQIKKEMLGGE